MKTRLFLSLLPALFALTSLLETPVRAGSAQWDQTPASNDWNTTTNWTPQTVPNGPSDVATFGVSNTTSVSIKGNGIDLNEMEVNTIVFNPGASAYTIALDMGSILTLSGAGVTNNSGVMQKFIASPSSPLSGVVFTNSATAGTLTTFTAEGAPASTAGHGLIILGSNTSGGEATFINNGGTGIGVSGGHIVFTGNSTAANANVINNGGAADGAFGGLTDFAGLASAGNGTFTNNGASVAPTGVAFLTGGHMFFSNFASAANGTFNNNGGTVANAQGGSIDFFGGSGGNGVFNNNPGLVAGAAGGTTSFGDSTAGEAIITNYGANFSGAPSDFSGTSAGVTAFFQFGTAGNATLVNNAGTVSGASGGQVKFFAFSSPGTATIVNEGASVAGALGGSTVFFGGSQGGAPILIANGGSNGGEGGSIYGSAGTSRIEVFGNGKLDVSAFDTTVGSIEGDGNIFVGATNLTVGSNNLSTTFSGVLQDGGINGGKGGSLTKSGTGTLTIAGLNTYTGSTTVNAGTLIVDGSIATAVTVNGGMLGGSGTIGGLTVNDGGVLSPGSSPGILHVKGNLSLALGANYLVELNGPTAGGEYDQTDVMGAVNLGNATLSLVLGFIPADGTTFTIINNDLSDPVSGMFNHLAEGSMFGAGGKSFSISYHGGDGNDVVLTSAGSSSVPDAGQTGFLLSVSTVALLAVRRLTTSRA